ncbi:hypothetical protein BDK51DRAFT_46421 [Blyttiomyces helicus]|uniref:Uncharacterized protein n=1 Tax=Blyttiomyces helicus TaxID=388810 RepID=A0A4P9WFC3_9FUNG|nr:hypothetical protein BDK51DRAFT_46421 [Blyttiomyces helicus]|eukprot:RKO90443.1 hypothetical protein BDK51DRAFT_46421 [Blyttiomyces helicus]
MFIFVDHRNIAHSKLPSWHRAPPLRRKAVDGLDRIARLPGRVAAQRRRTSALDTPQTTARAVRPPCCVSHRRLALPGTDARGGDERRARPPTPGPETKSVKTSYPCGPSVKLHSPHVRHKWEGNERLILVQDDRKREREKVAGTRKRARSEKRVRFMNNLIGRVKAALNQLSSVPSRQQPAPNLPPRPQHFPLQKHAQPHHQLTRPVETAPGSLARAAFDCIPKTFSDHKSLDFYAFVIPSYLRSGKTTPSDSDVASNRAFFLKGPLFVEFTSPHLFASRYKLPTPPPFELGELRERTGGGGGGG